MKIISVTAHAVLDYAVGLLLLALPFVMGWESDALQSRVLFILGALTIVYSLLTRYRMGVLRVIPFRVHLIIDVLSGIFLVASPWLLGFADQVFAPHVLLGLFEIAAVLMTRTAPDANEM